MRTMLCLAALLLTACTHTAPPPPNPPPGDATCADVCARYDALHCPAAQPTPEGATCLDVCRSLQSSAIVAWDLNCRVRAMSCDEADRCEIPR